MIQSQVAKIDMVLFNVQLTNLLEKKSNEIKHVIFDTLPDRFRCSHGQRPVQSLQRMSGLAFICQTIVLDPIPNTASATLH